MQKENREIIEGIWGITCMTKEDWIQVLNTTEGISDYDIVAIIISVLSLVITILSLIMQKRQNITNLQAIYFEEIFKEYFMSKIPDKLRLLSFDDNGKLSKTYRDIINVFLDMVIDSAYFAYAKKDFYDELQQKTKDLEEKLILMANNEILEVEKQNAFIYSVHEDAMDIIKYVNKNYHKF